MAIRMYNDVDVRTSQSVAKKTAFGTSLRKVEGPYRDGKLLDSKSDPSDTLKFCRDSWINAMVER